MFIFFHFLTAIIFEHNIAFEYVDYILYSIPCPLIFSAFHRPVLDQFLNFVILFAFNCGFQEQYNIYLQLWLGLEIVKKKFLFFLFLYIFPRQMTTTTAATTLIISLFACSINCCCFNKGWKKCNSILLWQNVPDFPRQLFDKRIIRWKSLFWVPA